MKFTGFINKMKRTTIKPGDGYCVTEKLDGANSVFTFFNQESVNKLLDEIKLIVETMDFIKLGKHFELLYRFYEHFNNFSSEHTLFSKDKKEFKDQICSYRYHGKPVFLICSKHLVLTPFQTNQGALKKFLDFDWTKFEMAFEKFGHFSIFAEWMIKHEMYQISPKFICIGIVTHSNSEHFWITRSKVGEICREINLFTVPYLEDLTKHWDPQDFKIKKSELNSDIGIEGVVFLLDAKVEVEMTDHGLKSQEILAYKMFPLDVK